MQRLKIGVIGSGISGLSSAWALSEAHDVTVFEAENRLGGHTNTMAIETADGAINVDTGFIVFNELNYPNLTAFFRHLKVETAPSDMSFAVSIGRGAYEYSGSLTGFFSQARHLASPKHWRLFSDIRRFFGTGQTAVAGFGEDTTLGEFLKAERYSAAFVDDHILPMGAAIWSSDVTEMLEFPARTFIDFYANHGLLQMSGQPAWRTVKGGSQNYIEKIKATAPITFRTGTPIAQVTRENGQVTVTDRSGGMEVFDQVIFATHADTTVKILADQDPEEQSLLSAFRFQKNRAVLHRDISQMPKRKRVWASWNYLKPDPNHDAGLSVTYWMNRLQPLPTREDIFVTLNPASAIRDDKTIATVDYDHPVFTADAVAAQKHLWSLQGRGGVWHCGAWFGYGFHEDGIQSGLAVAEDLGGVTRPWTVANPSGRIHRTLPVLAEAAE